MTLKLNYQLMTADEVRGTLDSLADQIVTANSGRPVVLLGIQRRGVPMLQRMAKRIAAKTGAMPEMGARSARNWTLSWVISMYASSRLAR